MVSDGNKITTIENIQMTILILKDHIDENVLKFDTMNESD